MENFSETNALVAKEFFDNNQEPLFPEVTMEKDGINSYEGLTPEAVARILALAIVDVQTRIDEPISLSIIRKLIKRVFEIVDVIIKKSLNFFPFMKKIARYLAEKLRAS